MDVKIRVHEGEKHQEEEWNKRDQVWADEVVYFEVL